MKIKSIVIIFLIVVSIIIINKANAQQSQNQSLDFTISPYYFDLTNLPGQTVKDKVLIRNNTSADTTLKLSVQKFTADEDGNLTIDSDGGDQSVNWVVLQNKEVNAKSKEWVEVPFTINIPQDAGFGYYWAIIVEKEADKSPLNATGAKISGAAAIPILLKVQREGAIAKAEVVEFKSNSFINEYVPVDFSVKLRNTGNVHVQPKGNIFINSQFEKKVATLDVNPTKGNIIPEMVRSFNVSWMEGFVAREPIMTENNEPKLDKNGKIQTKTVIHWDKLNKFRFGPYTANLVLAVSDGKIDIPIQASTTFWVIPYTAIAILFVGFIVVFIAIRVLLKVYIRRQIKRYQQIQA